MAGIFKAYDIRGIYPHDLNEEIVYRIGRAFVTFLGVETVLVGKDMRTSTPKIFDALSQGIRDQGANIYDIGLSSTDMFYFAVKHFNAPAGIMITASHNPGEYNGLKMVRRNATPIGGDSGIADIEKLYHENSFSDAEKKGEVITKEGVLDAFVSFVHSQVDLSEVRPLRVVMDAGNGMAGLVAPKMFAKTPIEVIPMFFEPDGSFPNHEANPLLEENRQDLIAKVKETGADFGVGFDGDSDRAFFVDEKACFIDGDFVTGLLGQHLLKKKPGATICYDVRGSRFVRDVVERAGGQAFMWKVGHAFMKAKMKELPNAILGGEVSGHFYFKLGDDFFCDNSYLPVFLVAEIISQAKSTLSEVFHERQNYFISGEINSTVPDADAIIKKIEEMYSEKGEVKKIDGLSVVAATWWFNLRKSNTEPLLRLNCEADSQENLEKLRDELLAVIRA